MIPMSVNSVDGKVSVIYFDATVTMNGKEFTSRKIIPTNTLKKDEKRNRISTEVIVESGVTNATVTGLDKINVKDILSPKEIEKYEDPNTKVDINISTKVTEITETVSKEEVSKAETELDNIIKDNESIEMNFHFCNTDYRFTIEELKKIRSCMGSTDRARK